MGIYALRTLCYQMFKILIKDHNSISLATTQRCIYIDTAIVADNRKIGVICKPIYHLTHTLCAIRCNYCHIEVIHLCRYGKTKEYHQHYGNK